jgi:hypothetical protein
MAQVHITEAELARDLHAALPVRRSLSELIGLAEQREKDRGNTVTLDEDFAADVEAIVHARMPSTPRSWD